MLATTEPRQMTFADLQSQPMRESAVDRLMAAQAEGRRASQAVAEASGPDFQFKAYKFAKTFWRSALPSATSSEACTLAMMAAGIVPHDRRAVGHVYKRLQREGVIIFAGNCPREFGHGTSGGRLYRAVA